MKNILIFLICFGFLNANNIFQENCLKCHNKDDLTLFIKEYTLKYSSKKRIKNALFYFLKQPTSSIPLMSFDFIRKRGYKTKSNLDDMMLKKAINIYYEQYNIKRLIK